MNMIADRVIKVSFLLIAGLWHLTQAQVLLPSSCVDVETEQDFEALRYGGLWYEYSRYPFGFELLGKCTTAEYGLLDNGNITVLNKNQNIITGRKSQIEGTAREVSSGKLTVIFNGFASLFGGADYWVLSTDYSSYSVVYSCTNMIFLHSDVIWILTRDREPSQEVIDKAEKVIEEKGFSPNLLMRTDQTNCKAG